MFFDPSSAVAAVAAAQRELDLAMAALAVADPDPWRGAAASAYAGAREAALVSSHAVEARLGRARASVAAFEQERATWLGLPHGWLP